MRVSKWIVTFVVLSGMSGCFKTSTAETSTADTVATSVESDSAQGSHSETTAAATSSTTTTQPAAPVEIEKTLVALPHAAGPGRLLVADTELSLASGTAIPPLPSAPCGFETGFDDQGVRLELTGCEFESEDAAEQYFTSWKTAMAESAPVYEGASATTTPAASPADWTGRTIAIPKRVDWLSAETRTDLVRRFGTRVYTATAISYKEPATDTVAPAGEIATMQQDFIGTNNITASTPGQGRQNEPARLSIRFLAPTWAELRALGTQVGPTGTESYGTSSVATPDIVETYERQIITSATNENGSALTVTADITSYGSVAGAQRASLRYDENGCDVPPTPIVDSVNAWTCPAYDGQRFLASAQDGRVRISLQTAGALGADPAVVAQVLKAWELRLQTLGFAMGKGDIEPVTTPARTAAALPTDIFDSEMLEGGLRLTGARSTIHEGKFVQVKGIYAPQFNGDVTIGVGAKLENLTDAYGQPLPQENLGATNAESWTTVRELAHEGTDSYTGSVTRIYDCNMTRLLPSGDILLIQRSEFPSDGVVVDQAVPCVDPASAFVTTIWDRFQTYSLASFEADEQAAFVRSLAFNLTTIATFYDGALSEFKPVVAKPVPDSPAGTVAEWRTVWKGAIGIETNAPLITSRVLNFATPEEAAAFVQQLAGGAPLTPFVGIDGVEGGSNGGLGIIVARRGKWVVTYESPGRTNWAPGDQEPPRSIEDFGSWVARNFRLSGLE